MIKTAIISVSDKGGIESFARELSRLGIKIISTGKTAKLLQHGKIKAALVSEITKFPEMLDGRVKSLHPNIFAGILADRKNGKHIKELKQSGIEPIDMVVVNFYPFEEAYMKGAKLKEIIEKIDIGGPSLVRAAAKNFRNVLIVTDPNDYGNVIEKIKGRKIDEKFRKELAAKAFLEVARYDVIIGRYFSNEFQGQNFPGIYNFTFKKIQDLRYGENPDQKAAFYKSFLVPETCVSNAAQLQGKELSYNNILDANDAFELVKEFDEPTSAVIKHTNPSGVASAPKIEDAYKKAYETDSKSAFGGVVALNRNCNAEIAKMMKALFVELIICPKFDKEALGILKEKKNLRLMETGRIIRDYKSFDMRRVAGGMLMQTRQQHGISRKSLKVVSKRKPTKEETNAMVFAWKVNKHVKSNSIVLAKGNVTVGIGAGQMSRVDAVKLAVMKSEGKSQGSVMSSDAFFPFRDGVDEAAKGGVAAIIHPGGSIRDNEVIQAADENNIAMVVTGIRLFKH
ncbi:bifunctional phosphoribosylaminoimidazolecarboxamide formyltransferase/IMP cyclohydrolase [Candidatus Woesearchaeota archaeon]|nr:bifunctional phosphoribosylaminoimidazolecarboxamide formyltransferase/IMP cyclohydrolase [Candidatus Woesearchaeota archaeon]